MCGIFGFKLKRSLNENDIKNSLEHLNLLKHRGPDNKGYFVDIENGVFLGHTRLSIIDLSKSSNQPFIKNETVLIYNGEIYNYKEIKEEFINKNFLTSSDTEVFLELWKQNKTDSLRKIDGMFAFSIYENKELYLGTDYFGEKPLYYVNDQNGFYFSSEPKVLINFLNLNTSLKEHEIEEFISLGFIIQPGTGFEKLKVLEKNVLIKIDRNNDFTRQKIFQIDEILEKDKIKKLTTRDFKEFKEIFIKSIRRRMVSDVPVGILLSSGLDSTLIAALISKELNKQPMTFTASFEDGVNELPQVKKITNYLNLKNFEINSSSSNSWKNLDQNTLNLYSVLNDNTSGIYTKEICGFAKKYIKVGITGIGGDELFYGYNNYDFINKYKYLYNYANLMKKISRYLSLIISNKKINNLNEIIFKNNFHNYIATKNREIGKLINKKYLSLANKVTFSDHNIINYVRNFDLNHSLFSSYLTSADRGSMSESLELRSPFLSLELLNFSNKYHSDLFKENKKIFVTQILKDYLPDSLINKKKIGFNFPLKRFLKNKKVKYNNNLPNSYIDEINQKIEVKNYDKIAFRLLMLEKFINKTL